MKKNIVFLFFIFLLFQCASDKTIQSKFINKNTFRVVAHGFPAKGLKDSLQKRYTAKRAALLLAQNEVQKKIKPYQIKDSGIVQEKYKKDDSCILTYQVQLK